MALKALIGKVEYDKLADALKGEYTDQGDGTYALDVEEKEYTTRLREFRDNNIQIKKQLDSLNKDIARFKDVDLEKYQEALQAKQQLEELQQKNQIKAGNIDEVIVQRTETMRQDYEKRLKAIEESRVISETSAKKYRDQVRNMTIEGTFRDAITKHGRPREGAMAHILRQAREDWQMNDSDDLVAPNKFDDKGQPMGVDEYCKRMVADHPYLFEASQGGGAGGGKKPQQGAQQGPKTLRNPDAKTFGRSLEDIASGKVAVEVAAED